jgi:uncharacterized phage infection (PIP) family protein YhgE
MSDLSQPMSPPPASPPAAKPKRERKKSRSQRWQDAANALAAALSQLEGLVSDVESAASELRSVQEEYEEWKDNLPENLAQSALGEKLEEVCNLQIEDIAEEISSAIEQAQDKASEAEAVDLPQGFGRD